VSARKLHLSSALHLPLDFVTQTAAIIARKRRGKTYTGSVLAEELVKAGLPFVVIDPTGAWWGLRASADGKKAGYPVTIIGGEHGDIPLERTAGKVLAELVVEHPGHYVLDVSDLEPEDMHLFAAEFGERLFKLKKGKRFPLHVFGDEADMIVPQVPESKVHARALRAYDKIVRRGGLYGLGITLITQRPALVSKNTLSQVELLIVLQLIGAQDRDAVEKWVRTHDAGARASEFMESLAALGLGEAWIWSPAWLNVFQRVQVRQRDTFNSSKTPEVGDSLAAPKVLAPVDLAAVREKVAASIAKANLEDPKALLAKVNELTLELERRKHPLPAAAAASVQVKEIRAIPHQEFQRLEAALARAEKVFEVVREADKIIAASVGEMHELVRAAIRLNGQAGAPTVADMKFVASRPIARVPMNGDKAVAVAAAAGGFACTQKSTRLTSPLSSNLGRGERAVLTAIAQHLQLGGASREQITVLTGYKRSTRDTFIQRLSAGGYIEAAGDAFLPTDPGLQALGAEFKPLPVGEQLRQYWAERLSGGEREVYRVVVDAYPKAVERDAISQATGYARSSRDTYIQRLSARKLLVQQGRGAVKASDVLFAGGLA
jgi:hypothetical protein